MGDHLAGVGQDRLHSVGFGQPGQVAGAAGHRVEQHQIPASPLPGRVGRVGQRHLQVAGVAAEVGPQPQQQRTLKRGQPLPHLKHRHRQQHAHRLGVELVVEHHLLPLLGILAGSHRAPTLVQPLEGGVGRPLAHVAHRPAERTHGEAGDVMGIARNAALLAASFGEPQVDRAEVGAPGELGAKRLVGQRPRPFDALGVDVHAQHVVVALAPPLVALVVHPSAFLRTGGVAALQPQHLVFGAGVGDALAAAPHTFGGRRAFVDGAVPAVRAQAPGLIGRCVGGADLQRVDHVAMSGGVEAVAGRQLDDAPPPASLILHHLGVKFARFVAAPHGRVEGDRVVQQHEVGQ